MIILFKLESERNLRYKMIIFFVAIFFGNSFSCSLFASLDVETFPIRYPLFRKQFTLKTKKKIFGSDGWVWDLIVIVPGYNLSFYTFLKQSHIGKKGKCKLLIYFP